MSAQVDRREWGGSHVCSGRQEGVGGGGSHVYSGSREGGEGSLTERMHFTHTFILSVW